MRGRVCESCVRVHVCGMCGVCVRVAEPGLAWRRAFLKAVETREMGSRGPWSPGQLQAGHRPHGPAWLGACRARSSLWGGETPRVGSTGCGGSRPETGLSGIVLTGHREGHCGTLGLWPTAARRPGPRALQLCPPAAWSPGPQQRAGAWVRPGDGGDPNPQPRSPYVPQEQRPTGGAASVCQFPWPLAQ